MGLGFGKTGADGASGSSSAGSVGRSAGITETVGFDGHLFNISLSTFNVTAGEWEAETGSDLASSAN